MRLLANNVKSKASKIAFMMVSFFAGGFFFWFPIGYMFDAGVILYGLLFGVHFGICYFFCNLEAYEFLTMINSMITSGKLVSRTRKQTDYIGYHDLDNVQKIINTKRTKY